MYDDSTEGILRFSHLLFSSSSFLLRCRPSFNRKGRFPFSFSTHVDFYVVHGQMSAWCVLCLWGDAHALTNGTAMVIEFPFPFVAECNQWEESWMTIRYPVALSISIWHGIENWHFVWGRKSNNNLSKKKCRASQMLIFHF